jgi:hypothetical protein
VPYHDNTEAGRGNKENTAAEADAEKSNAEECCTNDAREIADAQESYDAEEGDDEERSDGGDASGDCDA